MTIQTIHTTKVETTSFPGDLVALRNSLLPKLEEVFNEPIMENMGPMQNGGICSFFTVSEKGRTLYEWPEVTDYLAWIKPHILAYTNAMGIDPKNLKLRGVWANKFPQGASTIKHQHAPGEQTISALLYLQAPPGSGQIHINVPDKTGAVHEWTSSLIEGSVVIFDSQLEHWTDPNGSQTPKIVLGVEVANNSESLLWDLPF